MSSWSPTNPCGCSSFDPVGSKHEREEDANWHASQCQHNYRPISQTQVQCPKCGDWRFKSS